MKVIATTLPGVVIVEPRVFGDQRGFFLESYHQDRYTQSGISGHFVQDNHSRSRQGVLRGLHYQLQHPQGKLVGVLRGQVFDVAVDIRRGSPTFGRWEGVMLDDENHRQLYIPPGYAHGFCVLSEIADFVYKCTDYYHPEAEYGIAWNDPAIGIEWPDRPFVLSEKDARLPRLSEQPPDKLPLYGELG
ncbi:MAG: dTDP-4-dehydrorhamnose 3,5-epimerase [Gammaproteobacteria bacterium]|nr:dTDP-4-dehydrorhamnose 3,5-epimerase [Gammaproteobacteria bacterium]MCP5423706.1 dTDP-4-dehydrorhamnose 3,5-epimerase [Gammaproteobacteria bacterium]